MSGEIEDGSWRFEVQEKLKHRCLRVEILGK